MVLFAFTSSALAHRSPDACEGSGLGISLYSDKNQVHIGDVIQYSFDINDGLNSGPISCDVTGMQASLTTPDGQVHVIALWRTILSNGLVDSYTNVISYTSRTQDIVSGSLKATANVSGIVHQNDTDSQGSGHQGLNVTVLADPIPSPTITVVPVTPPAPPVTPPSNPPTTPPEIHSGGGGGGSNGGSRSSPVTPTIDVVLEPVIVPSFPNTGYEPKTENSLFNLIRQFFFGKDKVKVEKEDVEKKGIAKKDQTDFLAEISIPSIKVNAKIKEVGLTSKGAIGAPEKPEDTAWYNKSPKPGEIGNSIIDGHFGWKDGIPAVFDNLNKIKIGDKIYIENKNTDKDENKSIITFVVTEIKTYEDDSDSKDLFTIKDDKAHLVLVTCAGTWDKTGKSYSKRLVVFSDRE